jgi:hypothetical protein
MTDETTDISTLTPEQAGAKLAEMKAKYDGPPPSETPTNATEAETRLGALARDPRWSAQFFSGNLQARAEYERLTQQIAGRDAVSDALSGIEPPVWEVTANGELSTRNVISGVEAMREVGLPDPVIEQLLKGEPKLSAENLQTVMREKAEALGNAEFVRRLLAGGYNERRLMAAMNAFLLVGAESKS